MQNIRFVIRNGKFVLSAAGLSLLLVVFCVGCQTSLQADHYSTSSENPDGAARVPPTNAIQEGDVVSITFQYSTNFNAIQKVALDGTMNLEGVGIVNVAGKTLVQLQSKLETLYRDKTKDDPITARVISTTVGVYISGAVLRPGKIPIERPLTVLEAIMEAGGFDLNRANLTDVSVLRVENARQVIHHLDVKRMLQGKNETLFYLKPHDIVHIPTKKFNF